MKARALAFAFALLAVLACSCGDGGNDEPITAVERGGELVSDPAMSRSSFNDFACSDCHATTGDDERILSGYSLLGAASRPTYWGGYEPDLEGRGHVLPPLLHEGRPDRAARSQGPSPL